VGYNKSLELREKIDIKITIEEIVANNLDRENLFKMKESKLHKIGPIKEEMYL
jgi:hypothetical protein